MRLMAFCLKALALVIVVIGLASYINYLRTGVFWVPNSALFQPKPVRISLPTMQPLQAPTATIYKWREQGKWVYGDQPPVGVDAQLISEKN